MRSGARRLAVVVTLGLGFGLVLGWTLWSRAPDRVATALALLEDRCAPHVLDEQPLDTGGLVAVAKAPRGQLWVERRSRLAVDPGRRDCGVTDALALFDDEKRALFAARAETLGLRLLPRSTGTTPEGTEVWPLFRVVATGLPSEAEAVLILVPHARGRGSLDPPDDRHPHATGASGGG